MMNHDRDPILVYTRCVQQTPYTFWPFANRCQPSLVLLLAYMFLITLGGCKKNVDEDELAKPSGNAIEPSKKHSIELSNEQIERIGIQTTLAKLVVYQPTIQVFGRVIINPNASFDIYSPSAGKLNTDETWPKLASEVEPNQVLGKIKVRNSPEVRADLQSRLLDAESRLPSDRNSVESLQRIVEGLQRIAAKEVLSRTELDVALSNLARARAQVALDESAVNHWKSVLAAIDAPSATSSEHWIIPIVALHQGQVTEVSVAGPSFVEAGQHLLRIVDQTSHLIRLDIHPDMNTVEIASRPDLAISCRNREFDARFVGQASTMDTSSQFRHLLFSVDDRSMELRPGMLVQAKFPINTDTANSGIVNAIQIPVNAVIYHEGLPYVYVKSDGERFERRSVSAIGTSGKELFVRATTDEDRELRLGLQTGDQVVVSGAQVLLSREFLQAGGDDD